MPAEVSQLKPIAWLYALSALGYLVVLAYLVHTAEPFQFGWATKPPDYDEMLVALCAPLAISVLGAAALLNSSAHLRSVILGLSVFVCTGLLVRGWGLFVMPLAVPTVLLAFRISRVRA